MVSCNVPYKMFLSRGVKYSCNHTSFQFVLSHCLSIVVGGKLVLASPDSSPLHTLLHLIVILDLECEVVTK